MMLEVDGLGFVYMSKDSYDQAIILNDRFEGDCSIIASRLDIGDRQAAAIEYFSETAPEPLNILAPYLAFVNEKLELPCDFEFLCGALHQMSTVINFNEIVKVPKEVRANVDFTKAFIEKYKQSWETLEMKLIVTDVDIREIKFEAIEELLKRILPPLVANVERSTPAPQPVYPMYMPVQQEEAEIKPADVVINTKPEETVVAATTDEEAATVLEEDLFAALLDPEPEEGTKASTITAEKIMAAKDTTGLSKEQVDSEYEEASRIANLVQRFGR